MRSAVWTVCVCLVACNGTPTGMDAGNDAFMALDAGPAPCTSDEACDDGLFCNGPETCSAGACVDGAAPDCDDGIECTIDSCSEVLRECVSEPPDADGDGVTDAACRGVDGLPLGQDCDDADRNRFPGNPEICDDEDHDEDCDDTTFGSRDLDRDGFVDAACCNPSTTGAEPACGDDCDDLSRNTNPADSEQCNGIDDDCDGNTDEAIVFEPYFPDCDGDDFGDMTATPVVACTTPSEPPPCETSRAGWTRNLGTDCDDTSPSVNPSGLERCNDVDDDCDTSTDEELTVSDWYPDCDRDGWGDRDATPIPGCAPPGAAPPCPAAGEWAPRGGDCAEGNPARSPASVELCNNVDDDCDGLVDDVVDGEVFCALGEVADCTSRCGEPGTHVCTNSCRSFGTCTSEGIEVCNYCDDDLDGFGDEVVLAYLDRTASPGCNSAGAFGQASCIDFDSGFLNVDVLNGAAENTAGAIWFDMADLAVGYGPLELDVKVEVSGVPENGTAEILAPVGGWAVVLATGGDPSVGAPRAFGIPADMTGVAARWHWTTEDCSLGVDNPPPDATDGVTYIDLTRGRRRLVTPFSSTSTCTTDPFIDSGGTIPEFNGEPAGVTQRMHLTYTPDDPRTPGIDEERMVIEVPGARPLEYAADHPPGPNNDLPGGVPLRVGLTAGTYTQGYNFLPPGADFGMPVRVEFSIYVGNPAEEPLNADDIGWSVSSVCPP